MEFYRMTDRRSSGRTRLLLSQESRVDRVDAALRRVAELDRAGFASMRVAIAVVFLWIGGVKAACPQSESPRDPTGGSSRAKQKRERRTRTRVRARRSKFAAYEADSITPFVANNPVMRLFYQHPADYRAHLTREGELAPAQRQGQTANGTYRFANGLGAVEVAIGLLVLSGLFSNLLGALGAVLAFLTSIVTLSFLLTTPEAWVPALGDAEHGFPFLSGAGRLVVKDAMLFAGGFLLITQSARALRRQLSTSLTEKPRAVRVASSC